MEAYGEMWQAAESGERITDDAMIVERFTGHKVKLVQGKYENIKVTTPEDLLIAEVFLKKAKKMKKCYWHKEPGMVIYVLRWFRWTAKTEYGEVSKWS